MTGIYDIIGIANPPGQPPLALHDYTRAGPGCNPWPQACCGPRQACFHSYGNVEFVGGVHSDTRPCPAIPHRCSAGPLPQSPASLQVMSPQQFRLVVIDDGPSETSSVPTIYARRSEICGASARPNASQAAESTTEHGVYQFTQGQRAPQEAPASGGQGSLRREGRFSQYNNTAVHKDEGPAYEERTVNKRLNRHGNTVRGRESIEFPADIGSAPSSSDDRERLVPASGSERGRSESRTRSRKRDQTPFNPRLAFSLEEEDILSSGEVGSDEKSPTASADGRGRTPQMNLSSASSSESPSGEGRGCHSPENGNHDSSGRGRGALRKKPSKRTQTPFHRKSEEPAALAGDNEDDHLDLPNLSLGSQTDSDPRHSLQSSRVRFASDQVLEYTVDHLESPRGRGRNASYLTKFALSDTSNEEDEPSARNRRSKKKACFSRQPGTDAAPDARSPTSIDSEDISVGRGRSSARKKPSKRDQTPFNPRATFLDDGSDESGQETATGTESASCESARGAYPEAETQRGRQAMRRKPSKRDQTPFNPSLLRRQSSSLDEGSPAADLAQEKVRDSSSSTSPSRRVSVSMAEAQTIKVEKCLSQEMGEEDGSPRGRAAGRRKPSKRDQTPFNRSLLHKMSSSQGSSDDEIVGDPTGNPSGLSVSYKTEESYAIRNGSQALRTRAQDGEDDNQGVGSRRSPTKSRLSKSSKIKGVRVAESVSSGEEPEKSDGSSPVKKGLNFSRGVTFSDDADDIIPETCSVQQGKNEEEMNRDRVVMSRGPSKRDQITLESAIPRACLTDSEDSCSDEDEAQSDDQPLSATATSRVVEMSNCRSRSQDIDKAATVEPRRTEQKMQRDHLLAQSTSPALPEGEVVLATGESEGQEASRGREEARPILHKVLSNSRRASTREQTPFYMSRALQNPDEVEEEYSDMCRRRSRQRESSLPDIAEDDTDQKVDDSSAPILAGYEDKAAEQAACAAVIFAPDCNACSAKVAGGASPGGPTPRRAGDAASSSAKSAAASDTDAVTSSGAANKASREEGKADLGPVTGVKALFQEDKAVISFATNSPSAQGRSGVIVPAGIDLALSSDPKAAAKRRSHASERKSADENQNTNESPGGKGEQMLVRRLVDSVRDET